MNNWLPKSWLFEVYDTKSASIRESFTLILPPQSVTIKEKQRIAITKTFDSAFIDDYGPDNLEITIRGISGTAHAFPTYQTGTTTLNRVVGVASAANDKTGYTQQDAFFAFRDKIMRYKSGGGFETLILKAYNLNDEEAYEVVLLDFTLDRTSSEPWRYPFTISLFVLSDLLSPRSPNTTSIFTPMTVKTWDAAMTTNEVHLSTIQQILGTYTAVKVAIVRIQEAVQTVRNQVQIYSNSLLNIAQMPLFAIQTIVDELTAINGVASSAFKQGAMTISQYANIGGYLSSALNVNLRMWSAALQADRSGTRIVVGPPAAALPAPVPRLLTATDPSTAPTATPDAPVTSITTSLSFTSYLPYTVRGGDTLQRIALEYMNDAALWVYIAQINEIASNSDLIAGQQIVIPVISSSEQNNLNILQRTPQDDPMGSDIMVDQNGDPIIQGDLSIIGSTANVIQSINSQMTTPLGSSIIHTAYGLAARAGMAGDQIAEAYIKMAIRAALLFDPRIKRIDDLIIVAHADIIEILFSATLRGVDQMVSAAVQLVS